MFSLSNLKLTWLYESRNAFAGSVLSRNGLRDLGRLRLRHESFIFFSGYSPSFLFLFDIGSAAVAGHADVYGPPVEELNYVFNPPWLMDSFIFDVLIFFHTLFFLLPSLIPSFLHSLPADPSYALRPSVILMTLTSLEFDQVQGAQWRTDFARCMRPAMLGLISHCFAFTTPCTTLFSHHFTLSAVWLSGHPAGPSCCFFPSMVMAEMPVSSESIALAALLVGRELREVRQTLFVGAAFTVFP
ncbi:hypothetical protein BDZ97DRAFT_1920532 [Flammula alnicola]|nr:hypothetical protein BDZ97DRAFT_1920532 [Flammula alnicola]